MPITINENIILICLTIKEKDAFLNTKKEIKFYVKNKSVAKTLKSKLKSDGVKKAKIYVGKKLIYKNINN